MHVEHTVCNLCEAICGLEIHHDGHEIHKIQGNPKDPLSRGHICPKGVALQDLHRDPDRLRRPVRREGREWREISWEEAFEEAGQRLGRLQKEHGADAVAFYYGNPTAHSYAASFSYPMFGQGLKTRNIFSSHSVDALPRLLASMELYGNQAVIPVPDVDRTDFFLILGANPVVSNGSVMTAPGISRRLKELKQRGGTLVVVDPKRTQTAELAHRHYFIHPGTDAAFLAAMVYVLYEEDRIDAKGLFPMLDGVDALGEAIRHFSPEAVADFTGIDAEDIRSLARQLSQASSAVCYGRLGTCIQSFGTLSCWLIDALNILTGNLDRPGGSMFTTPAVDLPELARMLGQQGAHGRWRSRISGLPETNGEFPTAILAEEIENSGPGQIRGLITHAGNPILSLANGRRLDRAFARLEIMVSIDFYINETTRHAHIILPPTGPLERDHYALLFHSLAVRNTAHYSEAVFEKPEGALHDWEIFLRLFEQIQKPQGMLQALAARVVRWGSERLKPQGLLSLLLLTGPHRMSLAALKAHRHGLDFGPLEPRLPDILQTPWRRIRLAPPRFVRDLDRLRQALMTPSNRKPQELTLIGRRSLRSNNSWMHNSPRLVRGKTACTLQMHPQDATERGLKDGESVRVISRVGQIQVPLELTDALMPGIVSLPHGWGHNRPKTRLSVASKHPGASINDLTDDTLIDALSGTSSLNQTPVTVQSTSIPSSVWED